MGFRTNSITAAPRALRNKKRVNCTAGKRFVEKEMHRERDLVERVVAKNENTHTHTHTHTLPSLESTHTHTHVQGNDFFRPLPHVQCCKRAGKYSAA